MKKINVGLFLGAGWVAFMVCKCIAKVGDMSTPASVYTWATPFVMLILCGVPLLFGFLGGRSSKP